jgi:hypothetical protein
MMRWAGRVAGTEDTRNAYTIFVGKPEGDIPHGTPRRRWDESEKE